MRKDRNVLSLFSLLEKYIKKFFSKMIIMKRYNSIHLLIFFRNIRGCARNEKIISDLFFLTKLFALVILLQMYRYITQTNEPVIYLDNFMITKID